MIPDNAYKVKAFTIMEVTIAMMVAAIVIGITYTSFNIVSKSYLDFKAKNEKMAVLARLDQLMRRDFEQAILITKNSNSIRLQKNGSDINYQLSDGYIIRTTNIIDTFKVNTAGYQVFFEGEIKNDISDTDNGEIEGNRIDELSFIVSFQNENIPYHYYKLYSSANLITRNPNAIN